jgi:hypothetical protein
MALSCAVCWLPLRNAGSHVPVTLLCGHSFCLACVQRLPRPRCPLCAAPFAGYVRNYALQGLMPPPAAALDDDGDGDGCAPPAAAAAAPPPHPAGVCLVLATAMVLLGVALPWRGRFELSPAGDMCVVVGVALCVAELLLPSCRAAPR